jgi:hypothetical protein
MILAVPISKGGRLVEERINKKKGIDKHLSFMKNAYVPMWGKRKSCEWVEDVPGSLYKLQGCPETGRLSDSRIHDFTERPPHNLEKIKSKKADRSVPRPSLDFQIVKQID